MSRTRTGRAWIERHVNDPFVRAARKQGYRSRAAFKLAELDARDRLLRPGSTVLDLGAAPGGWSQVARERVGAGGTVVAVDLLEMAPIAGVTFLRADLREAETQARIAALLPQGRADLVISDMAPNLTGIAVVDAAGCEAVVEVAIEVAVAVLKPQGALLVKLFHGAGFEPLVKKLRSTFRTLAVRKPLASRSESSETYAVARAPLKQGRQAS